MHPKLSLLVLPMLFGPLASCVTYDLGRVIALDEVTASESVRRPQGKSERPLYSVYWHGKSFSVETSIATQPSLRSYVRRRLEESLGFPLEGVAIDYVGRLWDTRPNPVSEKNHFHLQVTVRSERVGGAYAARVLGSEISDPESLFGPGVWQRSVSPPGHGEFYSSDKLQAQAWADLCAHQNRLLLRLAVERLVEAVLEQVRSQGETPQTVRSRPKTNPRRPVPMAPRCYGSGSASPTGGAVSLMDSTWATRPSSLFGQLTATMVSSIARSSQNQKQWPR